MDNHEQIRETAIMCANKGSHFDGLWQQQLESLLHYWKANIKMDLNGATNVMLKSAGYNYNTDWLVSNKDYFFWYKYKSDGLFKPPFPLDPVKSRTYRMTIAVFETINYWCEKNYPTPIDFTKESLLDVLMHGHKHFD